MFRNKKAEEFIYFPFSFFLPPFLLKIESFQTRSCQCQYLVLHSADLLMTMDMLQGPNSPSFQFYPGKLIA